MSKVSISGNASGTGVFTIQAPNSNVDRVLSLPDEAGTVLTTATAGVPVNGPAFSAYQTTASSLGASAWTKVTFTGESFDTNNCYDTGNSRFTPTVAGYYQFNSVVMTSTIVEQVLTVRKNGSPANIRGVYGVSNGGSTVSGIIYMNGTTDFAEVYLYQGSAISTDGTANSWFQAAMVRGA